MTPHSSEALKRARLLIAFQGYLADLVRKGIRDNECVSMLHIGIKLGLADVQSYATWLCVDPEMTIRWLDGYEVPSDAERITLAHFLITETAVHVSVLNDAPVS